LKDWAEDSTGGTLTQRLKKLSKNGYSVPETNVLTFSPQDFTYDPSYLSEEVELKLDKIFINDRICALFPEDHQEKNNCFRSLLPSNQVTKSQELKQKIRTILQKSQDPKLLSEKVLDSVQNKRTSIVFMQLPKQEFSGLVFTKNPLNGLDETILEITAGKNDLEKIISKQVIFQNGKVKNEKDKDLLSSCNWLEEVINQSTRIEKIFLKPLFLEWLFDGEKIFWINIEPIQDLERLSIYSNKIAKDMLPGTIKPLVWSVNAPLNSSSWKHLIDRIIGKNSFDLRDMTKQFYYRAYFNMGLFGNFFALFGMPRETLEIMMLGEAHSGSKGMPKIKMDMKILRFLPRIALLAIKNIHISKKMDKFIQNQKKEIDRYNVNIFNLDEKDTIKVIDELIKLNELCASNVIVVRLVRSFHHTLIKNMLKIKGLDPKIEFTPENLSDVDAKQNLTTLRKEYDVLPNEIKKKIDGGLVPRSSDFSKSFLRNYERFRRTFGHLSDSTADMSVPQWREDPALIASLIRGVQNIQDKKPETIDFPRGLYGLVLRSFVKNFIDFEKYSSRVGFLYTYGYAQFRPYFLHIGDLFVSKSLIEKNSDIFYLILDEIREIIDKETLDNSLLDRIAKRKNEIEEYKDIILPEIIFGNDPPPIVRKGVISKRLNGLPSSTGYYEGLTKIVMGPSDINKLTEGDVLVIPYSDVSWTPLFAKAGAVISESGGILSHCSIIAREYGIPAVVAVEGATRIPDNTKVIIDGYTGVIQIIH
jgi:phosphohistidine swiveling domain-containing protein